MLPKFNFAVLTFLSKDFKEARNIFSWPQERVFGNLTRISLGEKTHTVHFLEDFRPAQRKNNLKLFVIFRDSLQKNIFLFRCVSQFINLHLLSKGTKMIPITCRLNERGVIGDLLRCNLEEKIIYQNEEKTFNNLDSIAVSAFVVILVEFDKSETSRLVYDNLADHVLGLVFPIFKGLADDRSIELEGKQLWSISGDN